MSSHPRFSYRDLQLELQQADKTIDMLKGALAAYSVEMIDIPWWAEKITRQQRALIGALVAAYPRYMSQEALCECMPHQDHAMDYDAGMVKVLISRLRKILGADAFETRHREGYRMSPAFMKRVRA